MPAFCKTLHDLVLLFGQGVHGLLRGLVAGDRIGDVLPPELGKFRIVGNVGAGRGPLDAGRAAVELHQTAEFRGALGEGVMPDVALADRGQPDMGLFQS